jgi:Family of unknown function (DUF6760)/T4 bacteriophage base plate protein
MKPSIFRLPGGFFAEDGTLHQEVQLSALTGREEELLAQRDNTQSASLVTTILSQTIKRLGTIAPVSETITGKLLVADRQFLLLKLRELTFGDKVEATLTCPWPDCGKKVDMNFSTHDIPVKESKEKAPYYSMKLSQEAAFKIESGELVREVMFRLIDGSDQEVVSPLLRRNEAEALSLLLKRCILRIGDIQNPGDELLSRLSPLARMEIEKEIAIRAPHVEMNMEASCPECKREFDVPFDIHNFFFGRMRTSLDLLYREIHYLAYHYHWSENEILDMTRDKRHKYIEVLADEIERLNDATS